MQPNSQHLETPLPRALRRQMARVAELQQAQRNAPSGAPASPATPDAGAATVSEAEPGTTQASAPTPAASAPTPAASDPRENDPVYWRERFRVMQGINDKLRTDHADAQGHASRQIEELTARVRELEQVSAAAPRSDKIDPRVFFSPEQIDRFGEDQCTAMAEAAVKAAQQQAQHLIDAEVKPIKQKAADDQKAQEKAQDAAFWNDLAKRVPEWEEINAEPEWLEYLSQADDDGEQRQTKLNRFRMARNAQGVAKVFTDYSKGKQRPTPPVVPGRGAGGGGDMPQASPNVSGKGYPSREEIRDYSKRAATIRNPRDPRFVTDKERAEFEARLKLPRPGG